MTPFDYPTEKKTRRHGPSGYQEYESYRPWLRDEFVFRCFFCLRRERWEPDLGIFEIDHLFPVSRSPELQLKYENLIYSCRTCNAAKGNRLLPDPITTFCSSQMMVENDGRITSHTDQARMVIRLFDLNDPMYVTWRMRMIRIVTLAQDHDPDLFRDLLAFPDDLPDLSALRPPQANTRPQGIDESYFAQRQRGELTDCY